MRSARLLSCNRIWIIVETCRVPDWIEREQEQKKDIATMTNIMIIYFLTTCCILKGKLLIVPFHVFFYSPSSFTEIPSGIFFSLRIFFLVHSPITCHTYRSFIFIMTFVLTESKSTLKSPTNEKNETEQNNVELFFPFILCNYLSTWRCFSQNMLTGKKRRAFGAVGIQLENVDIQFNGQSIN